MGDVQETREDRLRRILPEWETKKRVRACKIDHIDLTTPQPKIFPVDTSIDPFIVSLEYVAKHNPKAGGWYVLYGDFYESFAPASAFEPYATLIEPPADVTPEASTPDWKAEDEATTIDTFAVGKSAPVVVDPGHQSTLMSPPTIIDPGGHMNSPLDPDEDLRDPALPDDAVSPPPAPQPPAPPVPQEDTPRRSGTRDRDIVNS